MVFTYIVIGVLVGGTLVAYVIACSVYGSYYQAALPIAFRVVLLALNPAVGLISIICQQTGNTLMAQILDYNNYWGQNYQPITLSTPMWIINAVALLIIIALFLIFASIRLRKISKKG